MAIDPNDVQLPAGNPDELRALIEEAPELQPGAPVSGIRSWFARALAALGIVAGTPVVAAAEEAVQDAASKAPDSGQTGVMAVVGLIVAALGGLLFLHRRQFRDNTSDEPGEE